MSDLREPAGQTPGLAVAERPAVEVAPVRSRPTWLFPVLVFLGLAAVLWAAAYVGAAVLPHQLTDPQSSTYGSNRLVDMWVHWDGGWYNRIAEGGYWYKPGVQSPVAFWPSYPLVLRFGTLFVANAYFVGIAVTFLSGLAAAVLFHSWCRTKMSATAANTALVVLLVYPFAWYLFGAVYADAFCLAATLAAFVALERDKLWLAGMAGLVASAARPVGIIVALALVMRLIELRRASGQPLSRHDLPVFGAFAGVGAYCTYLWINWGNPLLFASAESAPGWDQGEGPKTWFKLELWHDLVHHSGSPMVWGRLIQGVMAVAVLFLIPRIVRRLGWSYAFLTFGAVMLPMIGTKDFQGTGRYLIVLFPAFAVLGELLADRPKLRATLIPASAVLLVFLTSQFARGVYLA